MLITAPETTLWQPDITQTPYTTDDNAFLSLYGAAADNKGATSIQQSSMVDN